MENFEAIYNQYEPMIYANMRKLRIYKNHEAFIQTGRIGLWQAWRRYDPSKGDFAPFAYRSIHGSMLDELKQACRDERILPTEESTLDILWDREELYVCLTEQLTESLLTLDEKEQQLIKMLFSDGYSLDEVAVFFGISKGAVKKRRERTLAKLKILLSV